ALPPRLPPLVAQELQHRPRVSAAQPLRLVHDRALAPGLLDRADSRGYALPASSVFAPCCSSRPRYHATVWAARPGSAVVPQTSDSVCVVSGPVLVRWASLTALPQGPSASHRHSSPPRSISWPEALNT